MHEQTNASPRLITSARLAVAGPIIAIIAYGWGMAYDETLMSLLGFQSSLLPLSPAQTYKTAYFAVLKAIQLPNDILNHSFEFWTPWFLTALLTISFLTALASKFRNHLKEFWGRTANKAKRGSNIPPSVSVFILTFCLSFLPAFFALVAVPALIAITAMTVYPPAYLGHIEAKRLLENENFRLWPHVTWKDDQDVLHSGNLLRCTEQWCGILSEGKAITVHAEDVRTISSKPH